MKINNNLQNETMVKLTNTVKTKEGKNCENVKQMQATAGIEEKITESALVIAEEITDDLTLSVTKEQKLESSKQYIQDALNELENIHNEIWDNFPEMYNLTKDLDGTKAGDSKTYRSNEDYESYYKHNCPTISQIASGESEPWKDIKTGEDAANLVYRILREATTTSSSYTKMEIDNYTDINTGELNVVYKVLDELENINDDTRTVVKIYREELENAKQQSTDRINSEFSMEARLSEDFGRFGITRGGKYGKKLEAAYINNADNIKAQAKEIKNAKAAYERAKADFTEKRYAGEKKTEKLKELKDKFANYYRACNNQIYTNGGLAAAADPNVQILEEDATNAINNAKTKILEQLPSPAFDTPTEQQSTGIPKQIERIETPTSMPTLYPTPTEDSIPSPTAEPPAMPM